jgi:alpha-beta hydrolase superfamily lysophospholipase
MTISMRNVAVALGCLVGVAHAGGHGNHGPSTTTFVLSDGNHMAGYVYGESEHHPLVIMVHGASDTHTVFDFAPGYRAADDLAQRGYGVLTVDRVGYGASSHPNGDTLDYATQARELHDVIDQVRGGILGFTPPEIVVLAPSAGADIAITEAGTYHDVDGLIICFNTAQLQPALFAVDVGAWFAQGDYFDFGVDFRTSFFYAQPWAVQWVIDLDNATRALVPRAEIQSALANLAAPFRSQIDAPVLLMQADHDHLFVPEDDTALFTSSPDVTFELLEHSGHKGFSHPTSKQAALHTVERWLSSRF